LQAILLCTLEIDAMPGKNLRLPIERRVIAIFADQHLCEQSWRGQSAGDQPFRRCRLHDLVAAAAGLFRAGNAHHTKLRRHPIQHLTDAFANGMEHTTATAAALTGNVEQNIFARQMFGQRLALGLCIQKRDGRDLWVLIRLGGCQVGVASFFSVS
jgi:hypothetical protein